MCFCAGRPASLWCSGLCSFWPHTGSHLPPWTDGKYHSHDNINKLQRQRSSLWPTYSESQSWTEFTLINFPLPFEAGHHWHGVEHSVVIRCEIKSERADMTLIFIDSVWFSIFKDIVISDVYHEETSINLLRDRRKQDTPSKCRSLFRILLFLSFLQCLSDPMTVVCTSTATLQTGAGHCWFSCF